MAKTLVWTLEEALPFVRELITILQPLGWMVALTGGVLVKGHSYKDLDIVLFPMNKTTVNYTDAFQGLVSAGMKLIMDRAQIHTMWKMQGPNDTKHVELWRKGNKRVDVFYLT